jgi:hypothetical protein
VRLGEALPPPYVFASNRFLLLIRLDQTPNDPLTEHTEIAERSRSSTALAAIPDVLRVPD